MNLIARAKDANKDQTYFIWQIKQSQLDHILFPVGEFDVKSDVRAYADSKGLITSSKPDSQGLCFVGQTSLREMLLQTLGRKDGFIYCYLSQDQIDKIGLKVTKKTRGETNSLGQIKIQLGQHEGAFLYTIGQRQNLGISNGPWFVAKVDIAKNEVIVCHQEFQQVIMSQYLLVKDLNWHLDVVKESAYTKSRVLINENEKVELKDILDKLQLNKASQISKPPDGIFRLSWRGSSLGDPDLRFLPAQDDDFLGLSNRVNCKLFELQFKAQIRYRSEAKNCKVYLFENSDLENPPDRILNQVQDDNQLGKFAIVQFDEPIKAAAKGQSIVFYDYETDQYLIGGGVIEKVLK